MTEYSEEEAFWRRFGAKLETLKRRHQRDVQEPSSRQPLSELNTDLGLDIGALGGRSHQGTTQNHTAAKVNQALCTILPFPQHLDRQSLRLHQQALDVVQLQHKTNDALERLELHKARLTEAKMQQQARVCSALDARLQAAHASLDSSAQDVHACMRSLKALHQQLASVLQGVRAHPDDAASEGISLQLERLRSMVAQLPDLNMVSLDTVMLQHVPALESADQRKLANPAHDGEERLRHAQAEIHKLQRALSDSRAEATELRDEVARLQSENSELADAHAALRRAADAAGGLRGTAMQDRVPPRHYAQEAPDPRSARQSYETDRSYSRHPRHVRRASPARSQGIEEGMFVEADPMQQLRAAAGLRSSADAEHSSDAERISMAYKSALAELQQRFQEQVDAIESKLQAQAPAGKELAEAYHLKAQVDELKSNNLALQGALSKTEERYRDKLDWQSYEQRSQHDKDVAEIRQAHARDMSALCARLRELELTAARSTLAHCQVSASAAEDTNKQAFPGSAAAHTWTSPTQGNGAGSLAPPLKLACKDLQRAPASPPSFAPPSEELQRSPSAVRRTLAHGHIGPDPFALTVQASQRALAALAASTADLDLRTALELSDAVGARRTSADVQAAVGTASAAMPMPAPEPPVGHSKLSPLSARKVRDSGAASGIPLSPPPRIRTSRTAASPGSGCVGTSGIPRTPERPSPPWRSPGREKVPLGKSPVKRQGRNQQASASSAEGSIRKCHRCGALPGDPGQCVFHPGKMTDAGTLQNTPEWSRCKASCIDTHGGCVSLPEHAFSTVRPAALQHATRADGANTPKPRRELPLPVAR